MTTNFFEATYLDLKTREATFTARQENLPEQITNPLSAVNSITAEALIIHPLTEKNLDEDIDTPYTPAYLTKDNLLVFQLYAAEDDETDKEDALAMGEVDVKLLDQDSFIESCPVIQNEDGSCWLWTGLKVT